MLLEPALALCGGASGYACARRTSTSTPIRFGKTRLPRGGTHWAHRKGPGNSSRNRDRTPLMPLMVTDHPAHRCAALIMTDPLASHLLKQDSSGWNGGACASTDGTGGRGAG